MARQSGRPSIVDDTPDTNRRRKKFLALVKSGASVNAAADAAQLGRSSVFRALQRGRKATRGPYREFYQAVQVALAHSRVGLEVYVHRAAKRSPELALKILIRRYPEEWNPEVMVRMMRIEAGLDPDSGKPLPTVRVVRETDAPTTPPAAIAPPAEGSAA